MRLYNVCKYLTGRIIRTNKRPMRMSESPFFLLVIGFFLVMTTESNAQVWVQFANVGQGDGIIIHCPPTAVGQTPQQSEKIVIDFGSSFVPPYRD